MGAPYPVPTLNDSAGIYELVRFVNSAADGGMMLMFLGIIWAIILIGLISYSASRAFTIASFITMILSIIMSVLDLVSPNITYLLMLFTAVGAVWVKLSQNRSI